MAINDLKLAKQEITKILIERAKLRGMITYSDLVSGLGSIQMEAYDPRLFKILGEISSDEDAEGRGMLSVIVVHKIDDMQPGDGFFALAKELGRNTTDTLDCWQKEFKKVHAYWSNQ